ncbi:MAG: hypothetical protein HYS87_01020 [Candidatus Colwellbacteria bacterium]|nr:hypothetical protein [Candidatus Colwellbacteria bacterium]
MTKKRKSKNSNSALHPETKASITALTLTSTAIILMLSALGWAGSVGKVIFEILYKFFGVGYYLLPLVLAGVSLGLVSGRKQKRVGVAAIGGGIFLIAALGIIEVINPDGGGLIGKILGSLKFVFGAPATVVLGVTTLIISILIGLNTSLKIHLTKKRGDYAEEEKLKITGATEESEEEQEDEDKRKPEEDEEPEEEDEKDKEIEIKITEGQKNMRMQAVAPVNWENYVPPPANLLHSAVEKPTVGDLRANANIIKRTLEGFGIPVEMGEITIGPKVTRYTLKPAEGVKLSKITALNQDLSLAVAAHPIRIEAPIPGKSLVGIEIPNKTASLVRLGSLITYADFVKAPNLTFALGRDVAGEAVLANLAKMPHLLIAGTTGSGKSIMIHSLLISLIYKNSPETMRMLLIDPKRVELSIYEGIPHLMTPVITEGKKVVSILRFAIEEMERRYNTLLAAGKRDIASYNSGRKNDIMPYIVIVVDELADLMMSYGREIENSIIRLAQMARATGIHLVLSTQRPSVEVITGLIKANITSRIALQVASQVDSRTILDMAGAEKLLGGGDLLFVSSDLGKPKRIQGAYVSNEELKKVVDFIKNKNTFDSTGELETKIQESLENKNMNLGGVEGEDELYDEAVQVVRESKKASASLLQRRLKVGYARAARLLDLMEEAGIIGPGEGAKPREVFLSEENES